MIYDRQWFKDVRATLDKASVLKEAPPQNAEQAKVALHNDHSLVCFDSEGTKWTWSDYYDGWVAPNNAGGQSISFVRPK